MRNPFIWFSHFLNKKLWRLNLILKRKKDLKPWKYIGNTNKIWIWMINWGSPKSAKFWLCPSRHNVPSHDIFGNVLYKANLKIFCSTLFKRLVLLLPFIIWWVNHVTFWFKMSLLQNLIWIEFLFEQKNLSGNWKI